MRIHLQTFSFQFAEQVLNSKLAIKQEIESVLTDSCIDVIQLSRPRINELLGETFPAKSWERQHAVFDESDNPSAKMDFVKERVHIEVAGHSWKPFTNDV